MNEKHENPKGILERIFSKVNEWAREDEWTRQVWAVEEEMLSITTCYNKWLTLRGGEVHCKSFFDEFCAEMDYAPSISQGAMYYAVDELREIARNRARLAVTGE